MVKQMAKSKVRVDVPRRKPKATAEVMMEAKPFDLTTVITDTLKKD